MSRRAVRHRDGRPRPAPDERRARQRRPRARRRDDRGVRRRRLCRAVGAPVLAEGDRQRRADAAADPAPTRGPGAVLGTARRSGAEMKRTASVTGQQPVPVGRCARDLPRAGAAAAARRRGGRQPDRGGAPADVSRRSSGSTCRRRRAHEAGALRAERQRPRARRRSPRPRRAERVAVGARGGRPIRRAGREPEARRRRARGAPRRRSRRSGCWRVSTHRPGSTSARTRPPRSRSRSWCEVVHRGADRTPRTARRKAGRLRRPRSIRSAG